MAKYNVVYSCGHEGVICLFGKQNKRDWLLEKESQKLCEDCYKKELEIKRQELTQKAIEDNKNNGFAPLKGSEKQIRWAERIRFQIINELEERYKNTEHILVELNIYLKIKLETEEESILLFNNILNSLAQIEDSSIWIDNSTSYNPSGYSDYLRLGYKLYVEKEKASKIEEPKEVELEEIIFSANKVSDLITKIKVNILQGQQIELKFPEKNETFINLVKSLGYKWAPVSKVWFKNIKEYNGTLEDRLIEVCYALLKKGFHVQTTRIDLKEKIIKGGFEKELKNWIKAECVNSIPTYNYLVFDWSKNDDYYSELKKLKGFKYENKTAKVASENYQEILDFAKINNFGISKTALKVLEYGKKLKEASLINGITVQEVKEKKIVDIVNEPIENETIADEFLDK